MDCSRTEFLPRRVKPCLACPRTELGHSADSEAERRLSGLDLALPVYMIMSCLDNTKGQVAKYGSKAWKEPNPDSVLSTRARTQRARSTPRANSAHACHVQTRAEDDLPVKTGCDQSRGTGLTAHTQYRPRLERQPAHCAALGSGKDSGGQARTTASNHN